MDISETKMKVMEVMTESMYCFEVPFHILEGYIAMDKALFSALESIGTLVGQVEDGKRAVLIWH